MSSCIITYQAGYSYLRPTTEATELRELPTASAEWTMN